MTKTRKQRYSADVHSRPTPQKQDYYGTDVDKSASQSELKLAQSYTLVQNKTEQGMDSSWSSFERHKHRRTEKLVSKSKTHAAKAQAQSLYSTLKKMKEVKKLVISV